MKELWLAVLFFVGCAATREAGLRRQAEWQARNCLQRPESQSMDGHKACERASVTFCRSHRLEDGCATGLWAR